MIPGGAGPLACLLGLPPGEPRGSAVLVPGLTGSKEDFIAVMPLLVARGWAVAALDLRGQYESRCEPGTTFELEDFADDAIRAMAMLHSRTGQRIHLLGHSFGGLVAGNAAITTARDGNSRPRTGLASLTLLGSGPAALPVHLHRKLAPLIERLPELSLEAIWTVKEAMDRASGWVPPSDEVLGFLRNRFLSNDPLAIRAKAMLLTRLPDRIDLLRAALDKAGAPVDVIYGEHDDAWAPDQQDAMARRLAARRLVLPRTGHSPNAEAPHWLAAELHGFWSGATGMTTEPPGSPDRSAHHLGDTVGATLRLPAVSDAAGVRALRHSIRPLLDLSGSPVEVADVELVLGELLANAIHHGDRAGFTNLSIGEDSFRVEVYDPMGAAGPEPRRSRAARVGGHGIPIIAATCRSWGVEEAGAGKIVWAEISRGPNPV